MYLFLPYIIWVFNNNKAMGFYVLRVDVEVGRMPTSPFPHNGSSLFSLSVYCIYTSIWDLSFIYFIFEKI